MSSTRLPGKVLKPILGQPMLARQIERVRRSRRIDRLIVATSVTPPDDGVAALCAALNVPCYRGALDDVLDRFYQAARPYRSPHVVRLTADCPLADPAVIDATIEFYFAGDFDCATNAIPPTFPDGLDVEVFRSRCLEEAWLEAESLHEREHVTPFMYAHPERYRVGSYRADTDRSHLRWTVDTASDFALVEAIYGALYPRNRDFGTEEVLALLEERPELLALNQGRS